MINDHNILQIQLDEANKLIKDLTGPLVKVYTNMVGLFTIHLPRTKKDWALHFFPERKSWFWGRDDTYYDGNIFSLGFGPFLTIVWLDDRW